MNISFTNIPELQFLDKWILENEQEYKSILQQYQKIVNVLLSISDKDISTIQRARQAMRDTSIALHSASELDTSVFLKKIKGNSDISKILSTIFDFSHSSSMIALWNLQDMLEKWSLLARDKDNLPTDGDAVWDKVIWWHTQTNDDIAPQVMIHFLVSHYLCQSMNLLLGQEFYMVDKDDFINVLGDVILLNEAMWIPNSPYKVWSTSRSNGWLWWLDDVQLDVYKNIK